MTEMDNEESPRGRDEWVQLIRRTYGVPDIIGETVALESTAKSVLAKVDKDKLEEVDRTTSLAHASEIVLIIAGKGADHLLDTFLMDYPIPFGETYTSDPLVFAANQCIKGSNPTELRQAIAMQILHSVKDYIHGHKFRAECGCYFN
jgi:hypothetical protein